MIKFTKYASSGQTFNVEYFDDEQTTVIRVTTDPVRCSSSYVDINPTRKTNWHSKAGFQSDIARSGNNSPNEMVKIRFGQTKFTFTILVLSGIDTVIIVHASRINLFNLNCKVKYCLNLKRCPWTGLESGDTLQHVIKFTLLLCIAVVQFDFVLCEFYQEGFSKILVKINNNVSSNICKGGLPHFSQIICEKCKREAKP